MADISLTIDHGALLVSSPYLPAFVSRAHQLGGRWAPPHWKFDVRDETRVRELLLDCYGTDGSASAETRTVRVTVAPDASVCCDAFRLGGRVVAQARNRDSGARLGEGVVLISGSFDSGGSVKNWTTTCRKGAVVLMRDMPLGMCERLLAGDGTPTWVSTIAIEEEPKPPIDREVLTSERARLVARLTEIDAILASA